MTVLVMPGTDKEPVVGCLFSGSSVQELRQVLNRAMNTWEPQDWPEWLHRLDAAVDKQLEPPDEP